MARSRRKAKTATTQKVELNPPTSPATFLFFWLAVPMSWMLGYAYWLRHLQ